MTGVSHSTLIDVSRLDSLLGEARDYFQVSALGECASTNTLLLEWAEQGAESGTVIVADRQTAGRGSRGRHWLASPEASLTFSVLWRFAGAIENLSGLSLAVGVAVVRALDACGAHTVGLKWPNDILHGEAKLGGILVELHTEPDCAAAVIGIGLNLSLPENIHIAEAFALPPAALDRVVSPCPERHVVLAKLLVALSQVLPRFANEGFSAFCREWQSRNIWQGRPVRLVRAGAVEKEGICRGADPDGALLVETHTGIERCLSGDLSVRSGR